LKFTRAPTGARVLFVLSIGGKWRERFTGMRNPDMSLLFRQDEA
jgi:hypothetical protein